MRHHLPHCLALTAVLGVAGIAQAVPTGGFIAVLDADQNQSTSSKSIVIYDSDDMSAPLFAMYVGWKGAVTATVLGQTTITGDHRSPDAFTVDPATGDIYIVARDSDDAAGTVAATTTKQLADFAAGGVPNTTEGDYDILKMDFQSVYNHWDATAGGAYVTYVSDPVTVAGGAAFQDAARANSPPNTNEQLFSGFMTKIGEVATAFDTGDHTDSSNSVHLEFVDQDTLILVDRFTQDLMDPDPVTFSRGPNDIPENDREVRVLRRTSMSSGQATEPGAGVTEGGWNQGTTESWESTILGLVNMDVDTTSEIVSTAFYKDPVSGVMGIWIGENDPNGDQLGFFEIADLNGDDTGPGATNLNGFREFNVGGGPVFPTTFTLDDNPLLSTTSNDGNADGVHINPNTGDLFVIESGFFDAVQDEPSVIIREVTSYDNVSGQIEFGAWNYLQLDLTGLPDDDTFITESRRTVYDHVNNIMYFYDFDSTAVGGGGSFVFDWYALDLNTGAVTVSNLDVDESTRGFGTEDRYEFFCLGTGCDTFVDPFPSVAPIDGDLNGDGFVGVDDLNIVLLNWNQNVTPGDLPTGDPSGDGFVGVDDLNVVLVNWNNGTPPADGSVIPEPASLALFTMAGLSVLARRRSKA